tara:strand:- start:1086 stop:1658 length:573 start_codon:yes stop_codon:yes gene_type:complete
MIEVYKSIYKFHSLLGIISKEAENPFFRSKYASLPHILKAIQKPLQDSGLIIIHKLTDDKMETNIIHAETGEMIVSSFVLAMKGTDSQAWGSAITYAKRYSIGAMLNLTIDEDDDGNGSSDPRKDKQSSVSKGTPRGNDDDKQWLSQEGEQFDKALQFIREGGSVAEIRQKYKVSKKVATSLEEQGIIPF